MYTLTGIVYKSLCLTFSLDSITYAVFLDFENFQGPKITKCLSEFDGKMFLRWIIPFSDGEGDEENSNYNL